MPFHTEAELKTWLSEDQRRLVLSAFPSGAVVEEARYFDNYDLPCPMRVTLRLPDGREEHAVLRTCRHGDAGLEANVLEALCRWGLPVPRVLARSTEGSLTLVLSLLPGISLQAMAMESAEGLDRAQSLLMVAVRRLADLTGLMESEPAARSLPHRTLADHLEAVASAPSPWHDQPLFRDAAERLRPVLRKVRTPLIFTNGDTQPGNFLAVNGALTGFVDFENAGFEDPLIGFAKFPIYDLHPMNKAGFIERLLHETGGARCDFALRLALGCLMTLHREVPVAGGDTAYRDRVLSLLREALHFIP